jgi:hypothetical protein
MRINKNCVLKNTEDWGSRFIQNVGTYWPKYKAARVKYKKLEILLYSFCAVYVERCLVFFLCIPLLDTSCFTVTSHLQVYRVIWLRIQLLSFIKLMVTHVTKITRGTAIGGKKTALQWAAEFLTITTWTPEGSVYMSAQNVSVVTNVLCWGHHTVAECSV